MDLERLMDVLDAMLNDAAFMRTVPHDALRRRAAWVEEHETVQGTAWWEARRDFYMNDPFWSDAVMLRVLGGE